ncbi:right-handed parallel beta-helix repeat-containing protein [Cohnella rhizosphaerae]|uniref:Right-handed parallel beta-helix repeat-containing protein n=1 Tax=Cohnella rhizosphaerae TaxID=1457232 RepID=A0A9X4KYQ4_9BACL|nr:right-handed parallel beta-helix repeat-containing protein [Cohnella rhizosphaerae]MDG0812836.1 right-handed parallel beta-helix repeat-containing protein [Cohnella rhizosphaerae]
MSVRCCRRSRRSRAERGEGETYYVANDGDDANAGSAEAPFQSFAKGVAQLQPGDTLVIRAGSYSEALVLDGLTGTAQAPITIRGEEGANITASAYVNAPFWKNFALSVTNSEYVRISNLNLTFGGTPSTGDSYTAGISNAKHVTLQNNRLVADGPAYAVFYLNTNNESLVLDSNYVEGSDNAFYGYGLEHTTVTNNIFTQWWTFHFESGTSANNIVSNNVFAGTGEHFYGGTYENSIITNNIFLGNPSLSQGDGNTIGWNSVTGESDKTSESDVVATAEELFVSASDYHLKDGSPGIDAGTGTGLPAADNDGSVRYGAPDIGAYTYGQVYYLDGNAASGGDGRSEATAFNQLAEANAAVVPGATLLIKPGTYAGSLSIAGTGASDSKPIAIRKLGEGTVQINGGSGPAIALTDIANVSIDGLSLASDGNSALLADGLVNGDISNSTFTTAVHGMEITGQTSGSRFHGNTFKQTDQKGILLKDSSNNQIYNNVFDNYKNILNEGGSFTNTRIMNNVFISHYGDGANVILKGTNTGNTIANNIFRAEGPVAVQAPASFFEAESGNSVDYNLYDSTGAGLTGGKPANEANSVYGDPSFVSDTDFHLQMGSAAINRGTSANAPPQDRDGNVRFGATDIGAYEYAGDTSAFLCDRPNASRNREQRPIQDRYRVVREDERRQRKYRGQH